MQRKFIPLLASLILLEMACATPTFLPQTPTEVKQNPLSVTASSTLDSDGTKPVSSNKHIRYTQNFGGGGVGLGILLGPIGVASNAAMINSNTEKDISILDGKINIDPLSSFNEASNNSGLNFTTTLNPNNNVSPYIYITKLNETGKLAFAACLLIESSNGNTKWMARYYYELPINGELDQKNATVKIPSTNLEAELKLGFKAIIKQLQNETPESIAGEKGIAYISDFVTPRFQFVLKGKIIQDSEDRIWIREPQGVFALIKNRIKIQG